MSNGKIEITDISIIPVTIAGITVASLIGFYVKTSVEEEKKQEKCNVIIVANGELTRNDNVENESKVKCGKDDYKVLYQDEKSLIIYVYGDSVAQRYAYTNFVESYIDVIENEDGTYRVVFDSEKLTEENYQKFVNDLIEAKKEQGTQRKRS